MLPTDILMDEHRVIERVLLCLERMAERAFEAGEFDTESARDAVTFIRTFADRCHHGKEEARLFPALEKFGLPADAGPTAVMRYEHDLGRSAVGRMEQAIEDHATGDPEAAQRFAFEARGFVELLRDHIAKEDQVLFPMANRMLPLPAQEELLRNFHHVETAEMAEGTHERCLAIAEKLAARWGVAPADAQAKAHTCSCKH